MENFNSNSFLRTMGIYGYDAIEPVILAGLVSGDPILLMGEAGTGKTFLLNLLSSAMGLCHRHYNASQVSFDDLIGFPYPSANGEAIKFIPTPATIWEAESILVDELNRCKPEIQNKFFSLVHERKIMGMPLDQLKYRWAAMNPPSSETEVYSGAETLDAALADRFAFVICVPDWRDMDPSDQQLIIQANRDEGSNEVFPHLIAFLEKARGVFSKSIADTPIEISDYARCATNFLIKSKVRISPRRARQLARNIVALKTVYEVLQKDAQDMEYCKLALEWSIPHRAFKENFNDAVINYVHIETLKYIRENSKKKDGLLIF